MIANDVLLRKHDSLFSLQGYACSQYLVIQNSFKLGYILSCHISDIHYITSDITRDVE